MLALACRTTSPMRAGPLCRSATSPPQAGERRPRIPLPRLRRVASCAGLFCHAGPCLQISNLVSKKALRPIPAFFLTVGGGGEVFFIVKRAKYYFVAIRREVDGEARRMKSQTRMVLLCSGLSAIGLAHTATADILYTGTLGAWDDPNQYWFPSQGETSFDWATYYDGYSIAASGNQDGFAGFSFSPLWDLSGLSFISDVDVEWTFLIEDVNGGSISAIEVLNEYTGFETALVHGDTFTLEAGHGYHFVSPFDSGDNFSFGTIPAPSALALLGLAGLATRRRRK